MTLGLNSARFLVFLSFASLAACSQGFKAASTPARPGSEAVKPANIEVMKQLASGAHCLVEADGVPYQFDQIVSLQFNADGSFTLNESLGSVDAPKSGAWKFDSGVLSFGVTGDVVTQARPESVRYTPQISETSLLKSVLASGEQSCVRFLNVAAAGKTQVVCPCDVSKVKVQ